MKFDEEIERLIDIAIQEDIESGDWTSQACIPSDAQCTGKVILKQAGVIAGLPFFERIFKKIDSRIDVTLFINEGSYQKSGTIVAKVEGPTQSIVTAERTALNLLQHASGVATKTAEYVRRISGYDCTILDTRRTLPGLRALEKYAIGAGGGVVHRHGLSDRLIIKINHLRYLGGNQKRPIKEAFRKVQEAHPELPIEIEIDDIDQLSEALDTEAYAIILRNMFPHEAERCVRKIRRTNKRVYIDCGGVITIDTIRTYAETGVDGISVGALTHRGGSLDIALRIS